jgi:tellurite resistance protein TerC
VYFSDPRVYKPCARPRARHATRGAQKVQGPWSGGMVGIWVGFVALVLLLVALDLFVLNRKAHVVGLREALLTSAVWFLLAMAFNVGVYFAYQHHWHGLGLRPSHLHPNGLNGREAALLFFTGYVVEESLSVDNLFVMALIFGYFAIPPKYQNRVLLWGILGAQAMRGTMIVIGAALIERFEWVLYVFGAFLVFTAWKMLFGDLEPDPKNNLFIRAARRLFPVTHEIHGTHFAVRARRVKEFESTPELPAGGAEDPVAPSDVPPASPPTIGRQRWVLTPLALALVVVETTDLIFAVDSIPAVFAVTTDPFLVFTSNIFAILGLRSLYFALAHVLDRFKYLKVSLAAILALVGLKMLARHWIDPLPDLAVSLWTLIVVAAILIAGAVASVVAARREASTVPRS